MINLARLRTGFEQAAAEGNVAGALAQLQESWRLDPSSATAGFVVRSFEALLASVPERVPLRELRVFFLSSYTLDPILPLLRAAAFASGIRLVIGQGGFNDAAQLALDDRSTLYAFAPQLVFLVHQTRDVAPLLCERFGSLSREALAACEQEVCDRVWSTVSAIRARCSAQLVVHTLDTPRERALGILDTWLEHGQIAAVQRINERLARAARELGGVYLLSTDQVLARRGTDHVYDERRFASARLPFASSELLPWAQEWLRFIHPASGRVAKVVVCDLDNTLWGGVIGEDGIEGIQLGDDHKGAPFDALQRALLDLKERGILLALCSKNNEADALEALQSHPRMRLKLDDIAAYRINWQDKAQNLRELAEELSLGLDSFVFLDDNPVERAWVREQLPEVTVLELPESAWEYARVVRSCPLFERLTLTTEDRERSRLYAAERSRQEIRSGAGSLDEFLLSLEQEATVRDVDRATLSRVAQLTQKTNQFNLTTRRYNDAEIERLMADPQHEVLGIEVRDRFGDHGLVGVTILRVVGVEAELDTFLLSCRVLARGVETALLSAACQRARERGATQLSAAFLPTKKNAPALAFLPDHGFVVTDASPVRTRYRLDLREQVAWPVFIAHGPASSTSSARAATT